MNRESITPESRAHWLQLRRQDITSTEVSALFGCNPYMTAFELWHVKRGMLDPEFKESERMAWGLKLERTIAETLCERQGWHSPTKFDDYMRLPEHRLGSSFDYAVGSAILECKNVDGFVYRNDWTEDQAPPHIEMQVQHQLLVSGADTCHIAALVGGNQLIHLERKADVEVHKQILIKVRDFWAAENPPPADLERDVDTIGRLCSFAQPGATFECDGGPLHELVQDYLSAKEQAKQATKQVDQLKAQILMRVGEAEKVKGPGWTISAALVGPAEISYTRKGYRNFRVMVKK